MRDEPVSPSHDFAFSMKDHAAGIVSDEAFANRAETFQVDTPETKEGYFIREIFDGMLLHGLSDVTLKVNDRPLSI